MSLYYEDEYVTVHHGNYRDVLPGLDPVDHIICDPPYSEHVHGAARSQRMLSANDRGGKYGADVRRNVDLEGHNDRWHADQAHIVRVSELADQPEQESR